MKKRKTYSGSFKAKVISDLIRGKKEIADLAKDYQLHPNQIKNWRTLLFKRAHIVLDDRRHNELPRRRRGNMEASLDATSSPLSELPPA